MELDIICKELYYELCEKNFIWNLLIFSYWLKSKHFLGGFKHWILVTFLILFFSNFSFWGPFDTNYALIDFRWEFRFDLRIVLTLLLMQPRAAMRLCTARMLRRRRLVIKCVTSSPRDLDLSCNVHGGHVRNLVNHWVCLFVF